MPGNELVGKEELDSIAEIFSKSNGVLFAHGFEARRNHIFRVREFEKATAKYFEAGFCTAVNSGTAALYTGLRALGVGPGDEVITQAHTFVATVEAIVECGATPVVVDIDESLNMCPKALENAITKKTKTVIPVHMQGNPAKLTEILAIAKRHGLTVLEDSCQAIGATYKGRRLGSIGDMGAFSLDFGKAITTGEGGLIFTSDARLHKFTSTYHDHGHDNDPKLPRGRDTAYVCGFNFRMSEMQAAVGLAQLKKLDFILGKNRENKKFMKDRIQDRIGSKIRFRELTDDGELSDGILFFLPNQEITNKVVTDLQAKSFGFRGIPDAMVWHFAGYWGHIWRDYPQYANCFSTVWKNSSDLLTRCISMPVTVLATPEQMEKKVDDLCESVLKYL